MSEEGFKECFLYDIHSQIALAGVMGLVNKCCVSRGSALLLSSLSYCISSNCVQLTPHFVMFPTIRFISFTSLNQVEHQAGKKLDNFFFYENIVTGVCEHRVRSVHAMVLLKMSRMLLYTWHSRMGWVVFGARTNLEFQELSGHINSQNVCHGWLWCSSVSFNPPWSITPWLHLFTKIVCQWLFLWIFVSSFSYQRWLCLTTLSRYLRWLDSFASYFN